MTFSEEQLTSIVDAAYRKTRLHERNTPRQLSYEMREEWWTRTIARGLYRRTWSPQPLFWFVHLGPPVREVFTSPFHDAVVNMVLFMLLNPIAEKRFIFDTYSCRAGKGTLFGVERYEANLRSVSRSWSRPVYVLCFDISGFFMSIRRELLFDMIKDMVEDERRRYPEATDYDFILWLVERTLLRNPLEGCHYVGDPSLIPLVPHEKSIRYQQDGTGLTIGAVDHQLDSTIYLTPLDNYVKRRLHVRPYGRYVDDGRAVGSSFAALEEVGREIGDFIKDYGLRLHPDKTRVVDAYGGTMFLGSHIMPFRSHVRTPIMQRFREAMDILDTQLAADPDLDPRIALGPLNSRLGNMALYDQRAAVRRVLRQCPFILDTYRFADDLSQARVKTPGDVAAEGWPLWGARELDNPEWTVGAALAPSWC